MTRSVTSDGMFTSRYVCDVLQYKMNCLVWVIFNRIRNTVIKIRSNLGEASARHVVRDQMAIVIIIIFIVISISNKPGKYLVVYVC